MRKSKILDFFISNTFVFKSILSVVTPVFQRNLKHVKHQHKSTVIKGKEKPDIIIYMIENDISKEQSLNKLT